MTGRVLLTGAGGFVGQALARRFSSEAFPVRVSSRQDPSGQWPGFEHFRSGELGPATDWLPGLRDVECVIHCAGRAHRLKDDHRDPEAAFRAVNTEGTLNLARQAVDAGVRRFVFLSSIGVNGFQTAAGRPFSESDAPDPHNAYAVSKWEAEQGLLTIAKKSGLEVVIIRSPMVYGYDAPGNFGALARAVRRGLPLPLGSLRNRRSLVALDNLADFIVTCLASSEAAGQTFFVSDGRDLSTTDLLLEMARAAGVSSRLVSVPEWLLRGVVKALGKGQQMGSLWGNLQIDISKAQRVLGWTPPLSVEEGLRRAMAGTRN